MSQLIGVIGLVAGVFQNINTTPESWMAPQDSSKTIIRVYAGFSSRAGESTSGNIPGVAAWDVNGDFIGKAMGAYNYVIGNGKYNDVQIKGKKLSAEYVSVSAFGTDGLCVAAVGVTSPNGYRAGWFGDVGMKCGAPWYPSSLAIPGTNPEARPACVWIDQDASKGHLNHGITIHMPDFTGDGLANEYNNNTDAMCKSLPRFSMWTTRTPHMTLPVYHPPLEYNADGSDKDIQLVLDPKMMQSEATSPQDPTGTALGVGAGASALEAGPIVIPSPTRRRARRRVFQPLADQLVVSDIACHSAKEVCESDTSAGPDFVSTVEGLFCDMSEKILWPLCSESLTDSCFDLELRGIRFNEHELRVREEPKVYQDVHSWS